MLCDLQLFTHVLLIYRKTLRLIKSAINNDIIINNKNTSRQPYRRSIYKAKEILSN